LTAVQGSIIDGERRVALPDAVEVVRAVNDHADSFGLSVRPQALNRSKPPDETSQGTAPDNVKGFLDITT
jgi:hypothetical protein